MTAIAKEINFFLLALGKKTKSEEEAKVLREERRYIAEVARQGDDDELYECSWDMYARSAIEQHRNPTRGNVFRAMLYQAVTKRLSARG